MEALAYSETMGDWRTHDGMDLAVSLGTKVIATAAGTVSKVFEDPFMGTTVEIALPCISSDWDVKNQEVLG